MVTLCPICSRNHPAGAHFCYHDGVALDGQQPERPLNAGSTPFPMPFVFPGGQVCRDFNQLVMACQNNWASARDLLGQGLWPSFFEGLGRRDLAEAARAAALEPDADRGLSQLLLNLPADTLVPPKLAAEPTAINLGRLVPGRDDTIEITVANRGMLLLAGSASIHGDWLAFDEHGRQTQKLFQATGETRIAVRILGNKVRASRKPIEGEITIHSNGGSVKIPVKAEIAIQPFPSGALAGALTPREVAAKAKANPREAALLFADGTVKAWYERNGWTYPIQGPAASGVGAVQQFYEVLGLVKPPPLAIDCEYVPLRGKPGERVNGQVVVSTGENQPVFAHADSNQVWLIPGPVKAKGNRATIPIEVEIPNRTGEILDGEVTIVANGNQRFVVRVSLTVEAKAPPPLTALPAFPRPPVRSDGRVSAEPPPIVSSSGKRLTTLVRETVDEAVSQKTPRLRWVSELSVLALTLSLIAFAITWPFTLAGFGVLLGILGTVASGLALGIVLSRKSSEYGLPALGVFVSVQAMVMAGILFFMPPKPTDQTIPPAPGPVFPTIAELRQALTSKDPSERAKAVAAVGELAGGLKTARTDLLVALQDPDDTVRSAAVDTLGSLGPSARVTYPVLLHLAKTDPSETVRKQAQLAVKKLNPPTRADLAEFLVALQHPDPGLRASAALALGQIGEGAKDAVGAIDEALGDPDIGVRVSAAQALWEILGEQARGIVPVLVTGMQEQTRAPVRMRAAGVLGSIRTSDAKALDALEAAMTDADDGVRIEVAYALGSIRAPRTMPIFVVALRDREVKVRLVAAQALWFTDADTKGLPILVEALKDRDAEIRVTAAVALGKFGPRAKSAVAALALALKDTDAGVRARAAEALHHVGPDARAAVTALRDALKSSDPSLRTQAAYALSGVGPDARPAVPELKKGLDDPDAGVRLFAARALWAIDPQIEVVLPVMIKVLKEEKKDAAHRARAAAMLGSLGARAGSVAPVLHESLHDPDAAVRAAAARALGEIGGPQARVAYPSLVEVTKQEGVDETTRIAATEAIKKIGRPTKADLETLTQALEDPHAKFRAAAAVSLWLLNKDAKKAVDALARRLADVDDTVSTTAAFALAAIGPDAVGAVDDLRKALKNTDDGRKGRAAFTLGEIGPGAKEAVDELTTLVKAEKEKPSLRFQAARALWAIARQSDDLLPVLVKALQEEDADLNLQAAELLTKIAAETQDPKVKRPLPAEFRKGLQKDAVPALVKLLPAGTENVRAASATALGALGQDARAAVPALLQVLEDEDADLRAAAAETLGKIGAGETQADRKAVWAKAAYPALLFFSRVDPNDKVQRAAKVALEKIGVPGGDDADVFIQLLKDKNQPIFFRNTAGQVLAMIGPAIPKADVPRLGDLLKDAEEDAGVRTLVVYALGEVGLDAKSQSQLLVRALKDADPGLSAAAAYALGEVFQHHKAINAAETKTATEVRTALTEASDSPDENIKAAARAALKKLKAK